MNRPSQPENNSLPIDQIGIGAEILDRVIRWLSPLMALAAAALFIRAIQHGKVSGAILQVMLIGAMLATAFGHRHLKPIRRIYMYIATAAIAGIIGTLSWGLMGSGHAAILLSMIFASILGIRRFVIILGILMAAKVAVALVWVLGKPPMPLDLSRFMYEPSAWAITLFGFVAAGLAALMWEGIYRKLSGVTDLLQQSEQRYREMFNATNDALVLVDEKGRLVAANDAAYSLFKIDPEAGLDYGTNDLSLGLRPFSEVEAQEKIALALAGTSQIFEWQCKKTNGDLFWTEVSLRATTIKGESRLIAGLRDITQRKKAQAEMGMLQMQLAQSQKVETVGRLAGGVAHDFNNMLSVILGHVELALEQIPPEQDLHESLRAIQLAALRSADLTRQLLAYARKQPRSPKVLQLNDTIGEMIALLRRLIGETVNVVWVPGDRLWPLKVDPAQIDQILSNLCLNARDAVQAGGIIRIHTRNVILDAQQIGDPPDCEPGEYVMLAVEDNGHGMDRETMSNVFEPFFTTKAFGEGTGLGLSTVYGIVKQNRGMIRVESEVQKGSSFKIYFPRHQGKVEAEAAMQTQESIGRGRETILLVEDEPAILALGKLLLEKQGYQVLAANTPLRALQMAEGFASQIDLLITDVVMPEMNGRDLAKRLISLYPELKRIFMSGYTADVMARHGVVDDAMHFMQKPFTKKTLLEKVRAVLDMP